MKLIPLNTEWEHKDGEIYIPIKLKCVDFGDSNIMNLVLYMNKENKKVYVRTIDHFMDSFKEIK